MNDCWQCQRCGKCCRLFVFSGAQLSNNEWFRLKDKIFSLKINKEDIQISENLKTIPIIGKDPPKKCGFLKYKKNCLIYSKRPQICREYPIIIQPTDKYLYINVSEDCPRGRYLYNEIIKKLPNYIEKQRLERKIKISFFSFFEISIARYYGEEY